MKLTTYMNNGSFLLEIIIDFILNFLDLKTIHLTVFKNQTDCSADYIYCHCVLFLSKFIRFTFIFHSFQSPEENLLVILLSQTSSNHENFSQSSTDALMSLMQKLKNR